MDIPALSTQQMIEVDRLMIEEYGISLLQMMENAGSNLARLAQRLCSHCSSPPKISVLCGTGNNGGGGMAAARHLHNRGATVRVILTADPRRLKQAPRQQWGILQQMALGSTESHDLEQADLILDAMIGYGMQGMLSGAAAGWVERVNLSGRPILSLDAPSGLNTTSGTSSVCVQASATMTLALPKIGLLTPEALACVGELYLADISVPPELYRRLGLDVPSLFIEDTIIRM